MSGAGLLLSEAIRNTVYRPLLSSSLALLLGSAAAGAAILEAEAVSDYKQEQTDLIHNGANVVVVERGGGSLQSTDCDMLRRFSAVENVGWAVDTGEIEFEHLPGVQFREMEISPGLAEMIVSRQPKVSQQSLDQTPLFVGPQVATELGYRAGSALSHQQEGTVVIQSDIRLIPFDSELLERFGRVVGRVGVTPRTVDACLVEWGGGGPAGGDQVAWTRTFFDRSLAENVSVAVVFRTPAMQRFPERSSQHLWLGVGATIGLIWMFVSWFARRDLALYRTLGFSTRSMFFYILASRLLVSILSIVLAIAGSLVVGGAPRDTSEMLLPVAVAAETITVGLGLSMLDPAIWRRSRIFQQLKE